MVHTIKKHYEFKYSPFYAILMKIDLWKLQIASNMV